MPKLIVLITILSLNAPFLSLANFDYELNESKKCSMMFSYFERKSRLPKDTLHAISLQETGKTHSKYGFKIVWPWTINVDGKGYHFKTKREAVKFAKERLRLGKKSIDIGCMQINLKHHPEAFNSLEQAFSPKINIAYGAMFLRQKYDQLGNWDKAIGHYHSAHDEKGKNYQKSVRRINNSMYEYKNKLNAYYLGYKHRTLLNPKSVKIASNRLKEERLFYKKY